MNKKIRQINSIEEINEILALIKAHTPVLYYKWEEGRLRGHSLANYSFVVDKPVNIEITTSYFNYKESHKFEPCTFIFRKDGEEVVYTDPSRAYMILQQYYKAPDFKNDTKLHLKKTEKGSYELSAKALVGFNPKYDNTEQYLYVYDLNSAYAAAMMDKIPDTTHYRQRSEVNDGEVGFLLSEGLPLVHSGYADVVFKLIESPYKKFVRKYYDIKCNSTGKEKQDAKNILVYSVGYLQRKNPFLRSYIVNSCNEYMTQFIDENTILWNTDALYSLTKRPDLVIGKDIGQFKIEYEGLIRHRGNNYQKVGTGEICYRGKAKKWFSKDYNLLTDPLPQNGNVYELNPETLQMEVTKQCSSFENH